MSNAHVWPYFLPIRGIRFTHSFYLYSVICKSMEPSENTLGQANSKKPKHPLLNYFKQALVVLRNKFVLTIVVFIVWLTFFDRYNLIDMIGISTDIKKMENEKQYYQERIKQDSTRIQELSTNNENLEKFAREQYLMKKSDEVIFIVK